MPRATVKPTLAAPSCIPSAETALRPTTVITRLAAASSEYRNSDRVNAASDAKVHTRFRP